MVASNPQPNPLEPDIAAYAQMLPRLLDQAGRYAVIADGTLVGTFSSWEEACKVGYERVGIAKPFLVQLIERVESVNFINGVASFPCPT